MSKVETINMLFKKAVESVNSLNKKPSDTELLQLYGNYKQGTIGDINIEKPSFYMFKDVSKWTAWNDMKNTSKIQAQVNYIKIVEDLKNKYS